MADWSLLLPVKGEESRFCRRLWMLPTLLRKCSMPEFLSGWSSKTLKLWASWLFETFDSSTLRTRTSWIYSISYSWITCFWLGDGCQNWIWRNASLPIASLVIPVIGLPTDDCTAWLRIDDCCLALATVPASVVWSLCSWLIRCWLIAAISCSFRFSYASSFSGMAMSSY